MKLASHFDIGDIPFGDKGKAREVTIVIQKKMKLDGSFGPPELGPIKHFQAQINGRRVHADQFVFKPELLLSDFDLKPAPVKEFDKDLLIEFPRTVLIGISQGGMARSRNAQMFQLPLTASKPSGNFAQGMGTAQLAEKHGHKLAPTGEPLRITFCLSDSNQLLKLHPGKQLQQLAKYATKSIHKWPSSIREIGLADSIYHKLEEGPIFS
jgi:hypothetical protein